MREHELYVKVGQAYSLILKYVIHWEFQLQLYEFS